MKWGLFFYLTVLMVLPKLTLASNLKGVVDSGGIGNSVDYLACYSNNDEEFLIRSTAIPTYIQGLFVANSDNLLINFKCVEQNEDISNTPSAGTLLWKCVETRQGEGKYLVEVERSGVTGHINAYLKQEQIYPLKPQTLRVMFCK